MKENKAHISKGLDILRDTLAHYICHELSLIFGNKNWWQNGVINKLDFSKVRDLPKKGDYAILEDSLDIPLCLSLFKDIHWDTIFKEKLSRNHRTWAHELQDIRNEWAHNGGKDFNDEYTYRALDTMIWFCKDIDKESEEQLRNIRGNFRSETSTPVEKVEKPPVKETKVVSVTPTTPKTAKKNNAPICEKCGSVMVEKQGYSKFWGCSSYPQCKNSKPYLSETKNTDLPTVVLITCTYYKRDYPCAAKLLYDHPKSFFSKLLLCAKQFSNEMYILSSKYGLVEMDEIIEPYNEDIKSKSSLEIADWGKKVIDKLNGKYDINNTNFVILAGQNYFTPLLQYLPHYELPLRGVRDWSSHLDGLIDKEIKN